MYSITPELIIKTLKILLISSYNNTIHTNNACTERCLSTKGSHESLRLQSTYYERVCNSTV